MPGAVGRPPLPEMTQDLAEELFGEIVGRKYIDPGYSENKGEDRGYFLITGITALGATPHVIREPVDKRITQNKFRLVDLRDVLYEIDPVAL